MVVLLLVATLAQQPPVPQPFPRPGTSRPSPEPSAPPPPRRPPVDPSGVPTEASLGVPLYPNAQFIASYDAGRGQRFYIFGSATAFEVLVSYYRTLLRQRG